MGNFTVIIYESIVSILEQTNHLYRQQTRNFPGGRLPIASSATISVIKIEHKGFDWNLKALPFKINAQGFNPLATDPSTEQLCNLSSALASLYRTYGRCVEVRIPWESHKGKCHSGDSVLFTVA
jgi:hypothetical protein